LEEEILTNVLLNVPQPQIYLVIQQIELVLMSQTVTQSMEQLIMLMMFQELVYKNAHLLDGLILFFLLA
jgi:hypothetical protein